MAERFDPKLIAHPQARWEPMDFRSTSNVWKVHTPGGGALFAKDDATKPHGPHALHADAAASEAMHAIGLGEHVPPASVEQHRGKSMLVMPWIDGFRPIRDAVHASSRDMHEGAISPAQRSRARGVLKAHRDSGRLADVLAGEWLISDGDRHANNYLYHPGDGRLLSIDHDRAFMPWQHTHGMDFSKPSHSDLTEARFHDEPGHVPGQQDRISHEALRRMWEGRDHLGRIFAEQVAPHMDPGTARAARATLSDKLGHVRRLMDLPNPSLWHLNVHGTDSWREFEREMASRTPRAGE